MTGSRLSPLPAVIKRIAASDRVPENTNMVQIVDFAHWMEYQEDVVEACESPGDPAQLPANHAAVEHGRP
jgi:hypothetical protein